MSDSWSSVYSLVGVLPALIAEQEPICNKVHQSHFYVVIASICLERYFYINEGTANGMRACVYKLYVWEYV